MRDLHSFPTRRSSDLAPAFSTSASGSIASEDPGAIVALAPESICSVRLTRASLGLGLPRNASPEDRNSTRLDSRHVETSSSVSSLQAKVPETVNVPLQ